MTRKKTTYFNEGEIKKRKKRIPNHFLSCQFFILSGMINPFLININDGSEDATFIRQKLNLFGRYVGQNRKLLLAVNAMSNSEGILRKLRKRFSINCILLSLPMFKSR